MRKIFLLFVFLLGSLQYTLASGFILNLIESCENSKSLSAHAYDPLNNKILETTKFDIVFIKALKSI